MLINIKDRGEKSMDINLFGLWWIDKKKILCSWQFTFQWFLKFMIWKELKKSPQKFTVFEIHSLNKAKIIHEQLIPHEI